MAKKRESFFWTSYSDLMTSLFFIMLVLFVIVIVLLHKRMETTQAELDAIKAVENSTKDLSKEYFTYQPEFKKFELTVQCFFEELHTDVNELDRSTKDKLAKSGKEIEDFLKNHEGNDYLLIIEGQASRNSEDWTDRNYDLSFRRAYSLMKYWMNECKLQFGRRCEVQIAGSGDGTYNLVSMRHIGDNEKLNQRFLIYIIPKNIIENGEEKANSQ